MKVKYYITNQQVLVLDILERELCKRQISYVRIENEIHFNNQIVRILDIKKDKNIIVNLSLENIVKNSFVSNLLSYEFEKTESKSFSDNLYKKIDLNNLLYLDEKKYPKMNIKTIRNESKRNKQLLKRYKNKDRF